MSVCVFACACFCVSVCLCLWLCVCVFVEGGLVWLVFQTPTPKMSPASIARVALQKLFNAKGTSPRRFVCGRHVSRVPLWTHCLGTQLKK